MSERFTLEKTRRISVLVSFARETSGSRSADKIIIVYTKVEVISGI